MSQAKRITFTCDTPNDQGGIIANNVINWDRFTKNPVVLKNHDWNQDPIGMWSDIKEEGGELTGVPMFHALTPESKTTKDLYDGNWIRAASIGGFASWKTDAAGRDIYDRLGNRICEEYDLYEISIVTLPSNPDAVTKLTAKIYDQKDREAIEKQISLLSSKYPTMATTAKKPAETAKPEAGEGKKKTTLATGAGTETEVEEEGEEEVEEGGEQALPAAKPKKKVVAAAAASTDGDSGELPGVIQKIVNKALMKGFQAMGSEKPEEHAPAAENTDKPQNKPTGLKAEAEAEMESARASYQASLESATAKKKKAEDPDATDEEKESANAAATECAASREAYQAAKTKFESLNAAGGKNTNAAGGKPIKLTAEQLEAGYDGIKILPKPKLNMSAKIKALSNGLTFSALRAKAADQKNTDEYNLMGRVMTDNEGKQIEDYAVVLNSIMNDGKLEAVKDKFRLIMGHSGFSHKNYMSQNETKKIRGGVTLENLAAELGSGLVTVRDRVTNSAKQISKLNSTDNALASPALTTIEWLTLAIFKLFPSNAWKSGIPTFSADITGKNTGLIWANIAADPAIYKGTDPSPAADYSTSDTAVALALTPYWIQPMIWKPLQMHQFRYDQMGTQWAQAFSKFGAYIDDNLIYTLASTVPAASVVLSSGKSGYQVNPQAFNLDGTGNSPDAFYYNSAFNGNLLFPVLNDVIRLEQVFRKQNFELETEKPVLVCDPTAEAKLASDPEAKSLLTRWLSQDGGSFKAFKHSIFAERSRVAIVDTAAAYAVKDPTGVIPATSISAMLYFIASQVGIGLGILDVFMQQDPSNYGFRMSADIRMGIAPVRANFDGTALLTYGPGNV